jgi:hypothetical protein
MHNSIPCTIIVLQIHSFRSETAEILVLVFTKAYEICNLCCLVLMPLLLLWCSFCHVAELYHMRALTLIIIYWRLETCVSIAHLHNSISVAHYF